MELTKKNAAIALAITAMAGTAASGAEPFQCDVPYTARQNGLIQCNVFLDDVTITDITVNDGKCEVVTQTETERKAMEPFYEFIAVQNLWHKLTDVFFTISKGRKAKFGNFSTLAELYQAEEEVFGSYREQMVRGAPDYDANLLVTKPTKAFVVPEYVEMRDRIKALGVETVFRSLNDYHGTYRFGQAVKVIFAGSCEPQEMTISYDGKAIEWLASAALPVTD